MNESRLPLIDDDAPAPIARPRAHRRFVGAEAQQRRQRLIRYVLLFVSAAFMVNALVGDNGTLATMKIGREYARLWHEVNDLRTRNRNDINLMNRLKSDPTAIEEAAREDLGLIRPGETLVIIKDKVSK